jgi:hypothetical protein
MMMIKLSKLFVRLTRYIAIGWRAGRAGALAGGSGTASSTSHRVADTCNILLHHRTDLSVPSTTASTSACNSDSP